MQWIDTLKRWWSGQNNIFPCADCIVLPVGCSELCNKVETDNRKLSEIMLKKGRCPACGGKKFLEEQPTETVSIPKVTDSQVFNSEDGKYKVNFPKGWEIRKGFMGMDVIALSEVDGPDDTYRENANIIFADLDEQMSEEEYYKQNVDLLSKLLTDYNLEDEGNKNIDGKNAKWIKYRHRMGNVEATVLQYLFLDGKRAFVITFSGKPDDFDKFQPQFDQVVESFKFQK